MGGESVPHCPLRRWVEAGLREEQGTAPAFGMWEARFKQTCDHVLLRDQDAMFQSRFYPFP